MKYIIVPSTLHIDVCRIINRALFHIYSDYLCTLDWHDLKENVL